MSRQLFIYFQIQIKPSSTSYICTSYLCNISEHKPPLYQVSNKISRNKIIPIIQKLTQLKKRFISPHLALVQIYKLQEHGQYKMHGNVINVSTNVDQTQSILPPDGATICMFIKRHLKYKSLYMLIMFIQIW